MLAVPAAGATWFYHVAGENTGSWPQILSSIGLQVAPAAQADVIVIPQGTDPGPVKPWLDRVEQGALLVIEGESSVAADLGIRPSKDRLAVRNIEDVHAPKLSIVWEHAMALPAFEIPAPARVFAKERWTGAPVMVGLRRGAGAVLWIAAPAGARGYDRFPYLPQALVDLGLEPPFRSRRLWAFFDSSYRTRADIEYLADRWREAGIAALHVAAWHYWERDAERDPWLERLIDACHRRGILIYAWLELPHVSERFWRDHPEWREKTAVLDDAVLDWRRLINLLNRDAAGAVAQGARELLNRFDWDGVNLAELYFESLEGAANPSRFTPMNDDVRHAFHQETGFDPLELLKPGTPPDRLARFLTFRADLAHRLQREWIAELDSIRKSKPHLDLVLTHVDDRFDTRMRELIGADAARLLPLAGQHDFTFLIEDPATIWHLGPQRYPQIAERYRPLTPAPERLAIDVNIVERYQEVYPTKQQTGIELFQIVNLAARSFERVALYFENSISKVDLQLLSSAAAGVERLARVEQKLVVESRHGAGVPWKGAVLVDGRPWPVRDDRTLWLPAGGHAIEPATEPAPLYLTGFNGELRTVSALADGVEFSYQSNARVLARFDKALRTLEVDGVELQPRKIGDWLVLPRGQHLINARR